jgi:tRNA(Ser,Leu) C12 N-acetylase TAN1
MGKVEFCFVDAKGIHNKLFDNVEELKKAMEDVARLRPNSPTSLFGKNKVTGKPHRVTKGNFNWAETELIVSVILVEEDGKPVCDKDGIPILFTYITRKYVKMADKFSVRTARGNRIAIISSNCKRMTKTDVANLASSIGYSRLVVLQDVIIKEEAK